MLKRFVWPSGSAGASRGRSSLLRAATVSHSEGPIPSPRVCSSIASIRADRTAVRYASFGLFKMGSAVAGAVGAADVEKVLTVAAPETGVAAPLSAVAVGVTCNSIRSNACRRFTSLAASIKERSVRKALSTPRSF